MVSDDPKELIKQIYGVSSNTFDLKLKYSSAIHFIIRVFNNLTVVWQYDDVTEQIWSEKKSMVLMRGKSPHSGYNLENQKKQYLSSYLTMESRWWNTQHWATNYKEEEEVGEKEEL